MLLVTTLSGLAVLLVAARRFARRPGEREEAGEVVALPELLPRESRR
jgi:hypothetical protein